MAPTAASSSSAPIAAMASSSSTGTGSKLEPFLILARSTKPRGAAAAKLIQQVTEANGVYAFSELFELPEITELRNSKEYIHFYRLLELFAFGSMADYLSSPSTFPALTAVQLAKLRQLTLVTLAARTRVLPYSLLFSSLDLTSSDVRELEDLIIDATYAGLVAGKLNQIQARFEVDAVIGRDVRGEAEMEALLHRLEAWGSSAASVLQGLEARIERIRKSEAHGGETRQAHNRELYSALLAVQAGPGRGAGAQAQAQRGMAQWQGGEGMDLETWEEQGPAGGRGGSKKKAGSGSTSSAQRLKRSRA